MKTPYTALSPKCKLFCDHSPREMFMSLQKVKQLANPETAAGMMMSDPEWSETLKRAHQHLQETVVGTSLFLSGGTMQRIVEIQPGVSNQILS